MLTTQFNKIYPQYLLLLLCLFSFYDLQAAPTEKKEITPAQLEIIDREHQQFSSHFHTELIRQAGKRLTQYEDVKSLEQSVKGHTGKSRDILAINLIIKNIPMLRNNYDNFAIYSFIKILLDRNEWHTAKLLFDILQNEGDRTLVSNAAYLFAVFSFQRDNWQQTLIYLEGIITDLPGEDYHHALLIKGISLQRLTKHREAMPEYQKIPASSKYYISAQLNMAIANIRQGWWSDGHLILSRALKHPDISDQEESINRLYLTMGYSFLNQEYYRNSREAFRNISQTSEYTNQALLGLALTAANQEDYIGALNATRILKDKKNHDLSVDEAYLLMPYFYEKLKQHTTASAGYSEAISYYQGRIAAIQSILQSGISITPDSFQIKPTIELVINENEIDFSYHYPDYFIKNYLTIETYRPYLTRVNNQKLNTEYELLKKEYEATITKMAHRILNKRIEHLNSYMDQARFGVARLYDNNLVTQ